MKRKDRMKKYVLTLAVLTLIAIPGFSHDNNNCTANDIEINQKGCSELRVDFYSYRYDEVYQLALIGGYFTNLGESCADSHTLGVIYHWDNPHKTCYFKKTLKCQKFYLPDVSSSCLPNFTRIGEVIERDYSDVIMCFNNLYINTPQFQEKYKNCSPECSLYELL